MIDFNEYFDKFQSIMKNIDYKYFKELKKSKYAWGQYYQLRNELFNLQLNIYDEVNEANEENEAN